MISLADLRARKVTPIWQESVAVVQELIQTVKATTGSAELLPDLGHVALIPNGDVVAIPGSPEPANPVRHAAVMLQLLLEGVAAPPELEQFVTRNVAEPPQYETVAEFSRNLAFFERPGRRSDVERLVGRALAAEQTSRADEELQRLKERASEATQVMAPPEFLQEQQKVKTVPIALVAAIGVVILGAGLWLWSQVRANQAPASAAATTSRRLPSQPRRLNPPPHPLPRALRRGRLHPLGEPLPRQTRPRRRGTAAATPGAAPTPSSATSAQGERSLLDRASDAVRSAVNSLSGSASSPAPAVSTTPTASTEAKMAAAAPAKPRPRRGSEKGGRPCPNTRAGGGCASRAGRGSAHARTRAGADFYRAGPSDFRSPGRRGGRSVHRGRLHGDARRDSASRVAEGTSAERAA